MLESSGRRCLPNGGGASIVLPEAMRLGMAMLVVDSMLGGGAV
jgi:hypothetical protein